MAATPYAPGPAALDQARAINGRPSSQADHAIGGKHDKLDATLAQQSAANAAKHVQQDADHGALRDDHEDLKSDHEVTKGNVASNTSDIGDLADRADRHRADIDSNMDRLDALERGGVSQVSDGTPDDGS